MESKTEIPNNYISKRIAAIEVYNRLKRLFACSMFLLLSPIIVLVFNVFSYNAMIGASAIVMILGIYFLVTTRKEMLLLKDKYDIR